MKKALSLVLAIAVIFSCLTMVQLFTNAEGGDGWTTIISQDYSGTSLDTDVNAKYGIASKTTLSLDTATHSMKFVSSSTVATPRWNLGAVLHQFVTDHPSCDKIEVKFSLKLKIEQMTDHSSTTPVKLVIKKADGTNDKDVFKFTDNIVDSFDWTSKELTLTFDRKTISDNIADNSKFYVFLQGLGTNNIGYVDDVLFQVREYVPPIDHAGDIAGEFHLDAETAEYFDDYIGKTGTTGYTQSSEQKNNGSYSFKFEGTSATDNGDMLKLTNKAVSMVTAANNRYEVSAWFYFTSKDASATEIKAQAIANGFTTIKSTENTNNTIKVNEWFQAKMVLEIPAEMAAADTLEFAFTSGCAKCTFYVDDIAIAAAGEAEKPKAITEVKDIAWEQGSYGATFVNNTDYYAITAPTAAYQSAVADITAAVTTLLGSDDSVDLTVSVPIKSEGAACKVDGLVRCTLNKEYGNGMPEFNTTNAADWNTWYKTETASKGILPYADGNNIFKNMGSKDVTGEYATLTYDFTVCKKDLSIFTKFVFCFDKLTAGLTLDVKKITVSVKSEETGEGEGEGEDVKTPVGVKYTALKDTTNASSYIITSTGVITDAPANGVYTKSFTVVNTGSKAIKLAFALQTVHSYEVESVKKQTWAGPGNDYDYKLVGAGEKVTFSYSLDIENGKVTVGKGEQAADYEVSKFFYRFTLCNEEGKYVIPEGTTFTILCTDADQDAFFAKLPNTGADEWKSELSYDANGTEGGDAEEKVVKVPSGVKFILNQACEKQNYILSGVGVLKDIKDGNFKKSFKITNNGKEAIMVSFAIQTTHVYGDNKKTWAGPASNDYVQVTIEPGKTETVSYEMEVKDGKVEINKNDTVAEYELSKFFYRFDIKGADNTFNLPAGTAFTIACTGDDYTALSAPATLTNKDMWTLETVYSVNGSASGDFAPVAVICALAVASVALVVVAKKKKENEAA